MRKQNHIFFFVFLLTTLFYFPILFANPYQVPNSQFEQWEGNYNGVPQPQTWKFSNVEQVGMQFAIGKRSTDAHSGSYSVHLQDTSVGAMGINEDSPSWITLGTPWTSIDGIKVNSASAGTDGGINFSARPDSMSVWVKRISNGKQPITLLYYSWKGQSRGDKYKNKGDGCSSTTHFDEESDIRIATDPNTCGTAVKATQVAEGQFRTSKTYGAWTELKVPIQYYNNEIPQKMNIILSSCAYPNGRATGGLNTSNYVLMDDVKLIYSSLIHEIRFNGAPFTGFNPNKKEYVIELGEDATDADIPTLTCKRSGRDLAGNEITVQYAQHLGEPTIITVRAEDGSSTSTYTLTFNRKLSKNASPKQILVNGEPIQGFSGYVKEYNVELPYGTTEVPEIVIVKAEEAQTYTVETCGKVPCKALVTVYAENKEFFNAYTLNLSVGELKDNTLKDILINGKSLPGFVPTNNTYLVEMPLGTTEDPTIEAVSNYPDQQIIEITNNGLNGKSSIRVTPPAGSPRTYRISYAITESSYSYLKSISLDGVPMADFAAERLNYDITLPLGTETIPTVTWEAGDPYQTISLEEGGLNAVTRITVKAQNGKTAIYRLNFKVVQSSVATLDAILVDGLALPDFSPEKTEYQYAVSSVATSRPVVTWELGEAHQTVLKNPVNEASVPIDGVTKLTVRAQDESLLVYTITFKQTISDNTSLADLRVEGYELSPVFNAEELVYACSLKRGTESLPTITYVPAEPTQTIRVDENGVNGRTNIIVKAQSGATATYSIDFTVEQSTNCSLEAILVGGNPIENFQPSQLNYHYLLPSGTWELPKIEAVKGDEYQRVIILKGGVNGITLIKVVAESGAEQTYAIEFEVEKSLNANLQDILIDGVSIEGFDPNEMNYQYTLKEGVTTLPKVSTVGYPGQNISISLPQLLGKAYIEVLPEEGAKNIYTIDFQYEQSHNTWLQSITLDGQALTDFVPDHFQYTVTLPLGTAQMPVIAYEKGDATQNVQVISNALNTKSYVYVMAEDGKVSIYVLDIQVEKSTVAALQGIQVGGVDLEGFDPSVLNYTYTLPDECTQLPEVTFQTSEGQQVIASLPQLEGEAKIQVQAEDGVSEATYVITFAKALKSSASLQNILVNGIAIESFIAEQTDYILPANFGDAMPEITYEKQNASQQVVVNNQSFKGATLTVTAEDGTTLTYNLNYEVAASANAMLADLQYFDEDTQTYQSIARFAPDTYSYDFELPWRAQNTPLILPVAADAQQVITVKEGGVNGKTLIQVVAGDGKTTQEYVINFSTAKSDVATLSNIFIEGNDVPGFDPAQNAYTITLPYGTTRIPTITYEKGIAEDGSQLVEQRVRLELSTLWQQVYLYVIAENGTENVYTLSFQVEESGKANTLQAIVCGGEAIALQEGVYDYTVQLPAGSTKVPAIQVTKNYPEQVVVMDQRLVNQTSTILVKSNQLGVDDVFYHLTFQSSEATPAQATGMTVAGGTLYPAFSPDVTQYVALVSNANAVKAQYDADASTVKEERTSNTYTVTVNDAAGQLASTTYKVYMHYTSDVIPNGEFTSWSKTKYNNAQKPTSWSVPADKADRLDILWVKFRTGNECVRMDDGSVQLNSCWSSNLAGSIPGIMTLGDLTVQLKVAGTSFSQVKGGIPFHNTPDELKVAYKYDYKERNIHNMRILYTIMDDNNGKKDVLYTNAQVSNYWKEVSIALDNGAVQHPTTMNLTFNSTHSDNADDLGGGNTVATLYVDYARFAYSSDIQSIDVNGVNATPSANQFNVTVDSESQGQPALQINGAVADQAYDVQWYEVDKHNYQGTILSYAEDASTQTYKVSVFRPSSSNRSLSMIDVNGAPLAGFNPATLTYTYEVANSSVDMPLVVAKAGSAYQTIQVKAADKQTQIVVTAEDGSAQTYTVTFVEAQSADASLQDLSVEGVEFTFLPDQLEYNLILPLGSQQMPAIHFVKATAGQKVVVEEGFAEGDTRVTVVAEDGKTTQTYVLHTLVAAPASTAQLAKLSPAGVHDFPFEPGVYDYTYAVEGDATVGFTYEKQVASDTLAVVYAQDQVLWKLKNATAEQTYTVALERTLSNNAQLQGILVNGVALADFDALIMDYQVQLPYPVDIQAVLAEEGQSLTTTYDATTQTYSFTVVAANGVEEQVYTLQVKTLLNDNADLAAILVNGIALDGFDKDVLEYDYVITSASPKWAEPEIPSIQVQGASADQTIQIIENGLQAKTQIVVTAESGNQKVYQIRFQSTPASDVNLRGIYANTQLIEGFDPNVTSYTLPIALGEGLPHLIVEKADAFQEVAEETVGKHTKLTVSAQDGQSKVYHVYYETAYTGNSSLAAIQLDGVLFPGFDPAVYEYAMEFPVGTTTLPEITLVKGALDQKISIQNGGVRGDYVITVTADNGVDQSVYTIHFSVELSSESHLADIQINGTSLEGFAPEVYEYNYSLPVGTREWPVVSWVMGDVYQTVEKTTTEQDTWNATTTLKTLSQDGLYSQTYQIHFNVLKSSEAHLKDIQLDNVTLSGFDPMTLNYKVELPIGTKEYPQITYTLGNAYQTATIAQIDNKAQIIVVAEDGTQEVYALEFIILHSDNAQLNLITLDQVPMSDFQPSVLEYAVELPYGTTELPEVGYEMGDAYQTVEVTNNGLPGDYLLHVKAEDGLHEQTYVLHFTVAKSNNAYLSGLAVNGKALVGFDPEILDYQYEVAYGTTEVPEVTATPTMEGQVIDITPAQDLTGKTSIVVTAEDGQTTLIYSISYVILPSSNALLKMIYVGDEPIADFDPNDFDYNVALPYGTEQIPTVTWEAGDQEQKVTSLLENSTLVISVEAQDGTPAEYTLFFFVEKCKENRLSNIYLQGKPLEGFDPDVIEYFLEYEPGTDSTELMTLDDIDYELMHPTEEIKLLEDKEKDVLMIQVTAQNGDVRTYVIAQKILLSSNAYLDDLLIEGVSLPSFTPEQFEYTYILPYGAATIPEITYVKGYEKQIVDIATDGVQKPAQIFVTAEDGTVEIYRIHFVVDDFDPTTIPTKDNVCIISIGDGNWKFTTNCSNVDVYMTTITGKMINCSSIPLVDPNCNNICSYEANGYVYNAPRGEIIVYYFIHNKTNIVTSGKFINR